MVLQYSRESLTAEHYRLCELAKSYHGTQQIVRCPSCDHPKHYTSGTELKCRACQTRFEVEFYDPNAKSRLETTLRAVEAIDRDEKGGNDGWARCPKFRMIINSKGDGCGYVACPSGQHFYSPSRSA